MAEPPVIKRLNALITMISNRVGQGGDFKLKSISFILEQVMEELREDMAGKPGEVMELYLLNIGHAISWVGHGNTEQLPEHLKPFARMLMGEPEPEVVTAVENETSKELEESA